MFCNIFCGRNEYNIINEDESSNDISNFHFPPQCRYKKRNHNEKKLFPAFSKCV